MYAAHDSTLPFKDNFLRSQAATWASTLACTSDKFHSSWKRVRTTPEDEDESVTPAEGPCQGIATRPGTKPQTFAFVKIVLGSCYSFVFGCCLLHNLYVQAVGHKDGDIISERWNPCCKWTNKRYTAQGRICRLFPRPSQQGLQSEDIEKRWQGATLQTNRSRRNDSERFSFICITVQGL